LAAAFASPLVLVVWQDFQSYSKGPAVEMEAAGVPHNAAPDIANLAKELGLTGSLEPLADPLMLLRFYMARANQVEAAAAMHSETVAWREDFDLKSVMASYGFGEQYHRSGTRLGNASSWSWAYQPQTKEAKRAAPYIFFGRLSATAPDGGPVLVWRAGTADYVGFVREGLVDEMIRAFVAHFEDALQSGRAASLKAGRLIQARVIIDTSGFSIKNLQHLHILRHIVHLIERHFPEVSQSVTVVRAPWSVVSLYNIVTPWMSELVQKKVRILGEDFQSAKGHCSAPMFTALGVSLGNVYSLYMW
ncbi:sec14, partial [Symbiodinium pilosum]